MVGSVLMDSLRRFLSDVQTDTIKGQYWNDDELLLALNMAQQAAVNFIMRNKLYYLMAPEFVWTNYLHYDVVNNFPVSIRRDVIRYLHCLSAMVGPTAQMMRTARIYTGAEAYAYMCERQDAVLIIGDKLYFCYDGSYRSGGVLHYIRRPNLIRAVGFQDSFTEDVYLNIIVPHAAQILGMKEIQSQREYKLSQRLKMERMINPKELLHIADNKELNDKIVSSLTERSQK